MPCGNLFFSVRKIVVLYVDGIFFPLVVLHGRDCCRFMIYGAFEVGRREGRDKESSVAT